MNAGGNQPLISVILPYRDCQDTIADAIASLQAQDDAPSFEILAIDDGSRDEGPRKVVARATGDPRVRTLATPGVGIVKALNLGLSQAQGQYLARMDGDDLAHPRRFSHQIQALQADPRLAVIGCRVQGFPDAAMGTGMRLYIEWQNRIVTPDDHRREIFIEAPLCHPSTMIRRAALEDVGPWRDIDAPEDYDLWLRLDQAGWRMAKIPLCLLQWRQREGRATFHDPRYSKDRFIPCKAPFLAHRVKSLARPLVIWGAGPTGKRTARALEAFGLFPEFFVEVDPHKIGRTARRVPIMAAAALQPGAVVVVVAVAARGARDLIRKDLADRGFAEGVDFLCAA